MLLTISAIGGLFLACVVYFGFTIRRLVTALVGLLAIIVVLLVLVPLH